MSDRSPPVQHQIWKTRERKPETEVVEVPPIIDVTEFEVAGAPQAPQPGADGAPRDERSHPPFCSACGKAMTLRTREEWTLSLLRMLDQSPSGRGRLRGSHGADGEARYGRCRPHRAPASAAGAPRENPLVRA